MGTVLIENRTARVAPERQVANVRLLAVQSLSDVSTLETNMAKKAYWELLRDPRWQKRRLEIMQLAEFRCEFCQEESKTLNVHHRIYRKGANPWDYSDNELQCLCEDCHKIQHEWMSRLNEAVAELDSGRLEELVGYAEGMTAADHVFVDEVGDLTRKWPIRSYEHAFGFWARVRARMSLNQGQALLEMKEFAVSDVREFFGNEGS
jgi:hypothetical protein